MGSKHWTCRQVMKAMKAMKEGGVSVMKKKKSGARVRRERQLKMTNRERQMNRIRKVEDDVLRHMPSIVKPEQELSDFWYSAGRWEVFPKWMSARQKKVVRDWLASNY